MDWIAPLLAANILETAPKRAPALHAQAGQAICGISATDGSILRSASYGELALEVRTQTAVPRRVRRGRSSQGTPLLAGGTPTPERFASCDHVATSHRGDFSGPWWTNGLEESWTAAAGCPCRARDIRPPCGSRAATNLVAVVPRSSLGVATASDVATASGLAKLRASGSAAGDRRLGHVAPSHGRRPGASLAPQPRDRVLQGGASLRLSAGMLVRQRTCDRPPRRCPATLAPARESGHNDYRTAKRAKQPWQTLARWATSPSGGW